jgi:hypothetical protein
MLALPTETNESRSPSLADLLGEREPAREARRLMAWVNTVSRRPPLDRDMVTAMTARCHAEAVYASLPTALGARDSVAYLRDAEHARHALMHLRAVLSVALSERLLHRVQFDILSRQAGRTQRALEKLAAQAQDLDVAREQDRVAVRESDNRPVTHRPEEEP